MDKFPIHQLNYYLYNTTSFFGQNLPTGIESYLVDGVIQCLNRGNVAAYANVLLSCHTDGKECVTRLKNHDCIGRQGWCELLFHAFS